MTAAPRPDDVGALDALYQKAGGMPRSWMRRLPLAAHALDKTKYGTVLLPGAHGFSAKDRKDGPVVNLSYWIFPALPALKTAAPEVDWARVFEAGRRILAAAEAGPLELPPDWTSLASEKPKPAAGFPAVFGYNAIRIPLYLAWDGKKSCKLLRHFRGLWNRAADVGPFVIDLGTGMALEPLDAPGFKAVAALADAAFAPSGPDGGSPTPSPAQPYYPETLGLLSAIVGLEMHAPCAA